MATKIFKSTIFIAILIYLTALLPRAYQLNETTVYPDEITWMVKGKEFVYALKNRNINYLKNGWWNNQKDAMTIGLPAVIPSGLIYTIFAGTGKYSLNFLSDIVASRLPIVFMGSFTSVFVYLIAKKLKYRHPWLPAVLYALNPVAIGIDRWLIHDGPLTMFFTASIYYFLSSYIDKKQSFISGVFMGLAFLSKPAGILIGLMWTVTLLVRKDKFSIKFFIINCLSALITISIIWPQSWFRPIISIPEYLIHQNKLAATGDPIRNFYMGIATDNPNQTYYLFQIFTKNPEVILILFLIGLFLIFKSKPSIKKYYLQYSVAVCLAAFFCLMSVTRIKGGIRYILPVIPWIYLLACTVFEKFSQNHKKYLTHLTTLFIILSVYPIAYHPNEYLYYNSFIGGPKNAQKYDMVGLCFGSKPALEYLDSQRIDGTVGIVGCSDTGPYHTGRRLTKDWIRADILIVETAFRQSQPRNYIFHNISQRKEIKRIFENGVHTATIYR